MRGTWLLACCLSLVATFAAPGGASATPITMCPAVGFNTQGCQFLVTFNPDATFTTTVADPNQGPYDGIEDTLVGVFNNSAGPLLSMTLTSNTDAFGFDGDGACSSSFLGCTGSEPNGYGGFVS